MITQKQFHALSQSLQCHLCISEGIAMGVISYVVINLVAGKAKEKKISVLMYVLAVLFILKYVFL